MTIINLARVDPRQYLTEVDRALIHAGYRAEAEALRATPPRDLAEVFARLPDDVCIRLWETNDERTTARLDG